MSYLKNTASQKFNVLAINSATGLSVTGDAANISAKISIDSGVLASVTDTNPTELDATNAPGVYVFDLSQAETNGDVLTIVPSSTTANVQMDLINIYTVASSDYQADVSSLATAASIAALNDFDPASDTVANVTLVGTVTTNTDMVGTDNAALASSLAITNSSVNTIKTDTTTDIPALIAALNDFDPASDTVANVTLVGTTTTNTDMRGTDSVPTALEMYNYFTVSGNETAFQANVSSLATASSIAALNDFDPASDTVANVTLVGTTTTNTDMRGTDSANTVAPANSDITAIKAKTDQFVFTVSNQVDANALTGGGGDDAATIYAYFTSGSNEDAFKAELGSGSVTFTLTVNDGSNPIEGVSVWITTDSAGSNVVAGASNTNSFGQVTFSLDPGTYYQFNQLGGYTFNNPTTITVS